MATTFALTASAATGLRSTPPLTDPGMIADGMINYTVLTGRLNVNLSGNGLEFTRGNVVALHPGVAHLLVSGGLVGIVP
jgi:hypothetical protein